MITINNKEITVGTSSYFKLPIIEFIQNGNKAYLSSMSIHNFEKVAMLRQVNTKELKEEMKTIDIENIEHNMLNSINDLDNEPFNRPEEQKRVNNITNYLQKDNGKIIPTSIIVGMPLKESNLDLDFSFPDDATSLETITDSNWINAFNDTNGAFISENYLYVPVKEKSIIIIDGQHRFLAMGKLETSIKNNFSIPIVFLLGYPAEKQAEIFVTINYEQKPVNKSLLTNLKNTFLTEVTSDKILHGYIDFLNIDKRSPLANGIKMHGSGQGYISLAFLHNLLHDFIKSHSKRSQKIPIFRLIFQDKENRYIILQLLLYYFQAISKTLNETDFIHIQDVFDAKNNKCKEKKNLWTQNCTILTKTVGIGAYIQVMPQIILYILEKKNLNTNSYLDLKYIELNDFINVLSNINKFEFKNSLSGSSLGLMNQLKLEMQELFLIEKYNRDYAEKIKWIVYE